jgi:cytoskeletal protein CcmA (bactofilin family)
MQTIRDKLAGPVTFLEHTKLLGQVAGDATVPRGIRLVLHGEIAGDLTIEEGGTGEVRGMVTRSVVNRGRLELYGTIVGDLRDESGNSYIDLRSTVGDGQTS